MKSAAYTLIVASILLTGLPAFAGVKCVCRANGTTFEEGQVACLKLPSGNRLARCERVLNNTSWKMLGEGCPSVRMSFPPDAGDTSLDVPATLRKSG